MSFLVYLSMSVVCPGHISIRIKIVKDLPLSDGCVRTLGRPGIPESN